MTDLFTPLTLGDLKAKNRIFMSPLTRCRSGKDRIPNALMASYYAQRASAGLIITEATSVTPMGVGYPATPGLWSDAQVEGWKQITDAVHKKGGLIVNQLWHVGRISHSSYLNGALPVAPSAIAASGHVNLVRPITPYEVPRALRLDEIPGIVEAYRQGAANAKKAGFDGVEIHGANGYLLDQFLQDNSNKRTDIYGGSLENRARLMLEVTDAAIDIWGAGRVGMHLAPRCDSQSMGDSNPAQTFGYVAEQLKKRNIAFICAREHLAADSLSPQLKKIFGGVYVLNEAFTQETAEQAVAANVADAIAFGKSYIANPDLVERFAKHASLNAPIPETFYGEGEKGYTDYPLLAE